MYLWLGDGDCAHDCRVVVLASRAWEAGWSRSLPPLGLHASPGSPQGPGQELTGSVEGHPRCVSLLVGHLWLPVGRMYNGKPQR